MLKDEKNRSFTQLLAWQEGHKLVLQIYVLTKLFPASENFGLVTQLRRAGVSITSNIAEGFSRQSKKEKCNFYYTAMGSISETQNQLLIARDQGYISEIDFRGIAAQTTTVSKLLNGLIKSIKKSIE